MSSSQVGKCEHGGRHWLNLYLAPKGSMIVLITVLPEYASPKVFILQEYLREPGELSHALMSSCSVPILPNPDGFL